MKHFMWFRNKTCPSSDDVKPNWNHNQFGLLQIGPQGFKLDIIPQILRSISCYKAIRTNPRQLRQFSILHRPPLFSLQLPAQNGECFSNFHYPDWLLSAIPFYFYSPFDFDLFASDRIWIISIMCSLSSGTWRSGESLSSTTAKTTAGLSSLSMSLIRTGYV